jgi:flagellar basal body-associated protein FliL
MTMAEAEGEAPAEEKKGGGKKKLILMIVVILAIGFVVAKKTVLKPPPLTAKQVAAKEALETYELESKCAAANDLPPPPAPKVEGAEKGKKKEKDAHAAEPHEEVIGPVIEIDPTTLNLAGGHFLKIGLAVQLPVGSDLEHVAEAENFHAITGQIVLDTFSNEAMEDILPTKQREALRHEIGNEVCIKSHGHASTVYFTEFVAQ